jgi:hypothetical protein
MSEISSVLRTKLYEMVEHLQEKLAPSADGSKKRLHETTVDNLKEFLTDFPFRNVSNDTELEAVVAKVKALIGDTDAATIRTSEDFRAKVHAGMAEVTATLGTLVEEAPSRKFRLDD